MKRLAALFLASLLLLSLCACGSDPQKPLAPQGQESAAFPGETTVQTETPETRPPILPPADDFSVMAASMGKDAADTLWTNRDAFEGAGSLYEVLPENIASAGNFCFAGELLYFTAKEYSQSIDPAKLYVYDTVSGECTLLAENVSPAGTFCLLGDSTLLYAADSGLWSIALPEGAAAEVLPDGMQLLSAGSGYVYYTKSDGAVYRNDSTFAAEAKLLDAAPSYWLCPGGDTLCTLAYTDSIASIEFRALDGTLRSRQLLEETPTGLYADGERLYVTQTVAQTILIYDLAGGELMGTIPLPGAYMSCRIVYADEESIYYEALESGSFSLYRMNADGTDPVKVLENLPF